MASAPYEVQLAPADIYYAPIAEPFPDVDTAPAGNWVTLALSTRITDKGIVATGAIAEVMIRGLGSVAPVKAGINTRDATFEFDVMDLSAEVVALAGGGDPADIVTAAAGGGHPGTKKIALPASPVPQGWAILIRWDQSASGDGFSSQLEIKSAVQIGAGGFTFNKSNPNAPMFKLAALYTDSDWVVFTQQTSIAS